jgi:hypothetical protein
MMVDVQVRPASSPVRRVRILLRDGSELEAGLHLSAGQALAPYLSTRKSGWINLVDARWPGSDEVLPHLVLQGEHMLAMLPLDSAVPVMAAPLSQELRKVQIRLEDGRRLRGQLALSERQRLADYLHSAGHYLPCSEAGWVDGEALGRIVLNVSAIRELHEAP